MIDKKKWHQSRMVWLGVLTIVGAAVTAWASGGTWKEAVIAAVGAAIIFLRTDTTAAITKGDL